MKQLWAPWRLQFIVDHKKRPSKGCVFCDVLSQPPSVASLVMATSKHWAVVLNRYPYNNGHLLLLSKAHVATVSDLTEAAQKSLGCALGCLEAALKECYVPDGVNLGYNLGKAAGAGIPDHLHIHAVPRWTGDTNFLPVLGETRCIPEHLETMYSKLQPLVQKHFREGV